MSSKQGVKVASTRKHHKTKAGKVSASYEKALAGNPDAEAIKAVLIQHPDAPDLRGRHDQGISVVSLEDTDIPISAATEMQSVGKEIANWLLAIGEPALIVVALLLLSGQSSRSVAAQLGITQDSVLSMKKRLIAIRPGLAAALSPPPRRYPFFTPIQEA